jgi:peptidoglycan LD-endopeptidase CwlK
MPAALFKRINLDFLYAPFLEKLLDAISDCKTTGVEYTATLGFRTYAEQDALFAQGRTTPGHIVTNARGGESAHNFGLAVDFFAGDWDPQSYERLGSMVALRGLVWGGSWKKPDRPHVQWPGYVSAADMAPLAALTLPDSRESDQDVLRRVWAYLDANKGKI